MMSNDASEALSFIRSKGIIVGEVLHVSEHEGKIDFSVNYLPNNRITHIIYEEIDSDIVVTVDEGNVSDEILFKDNLIRRFIDDNKYDDIIYKAVKYHNKMNLNYELTSREELFCKAIRDADKLDIFFVATYDDNIKDFYILPYVEGAKLDSKVKEDFDSHRLVDLRNRKTAIDKLANILAFVYDLNLQASKRIITKDTIDNIINTFIKTFNVKDTSECLYLKDNILEYLNNT